MAVIGRPKIQENDAITRQIVRLYSQGMSAAKVAKIVCFSETGVNYRLKIAGVSKRSKQKRGIPQWQINQIRTLKKEGICTYKIAEMVGVSVPTARKYIRSGGENNAKSIGKNG